MARHGRHLGIRGGGRVRGCAPARANGPLRGGAGNCRTEDLMECFGGDLDVTKLEAHFEAGETVELKTAASKEVQHSVKEKDDLDDSKLTDKEDVEQLEKLVDLLPDCVLKLAEFPNLKAQLHHVLPRAA